MVYHITVADQMKLIWWLPNGNKTEIQMLLSVLHLYPLVISTMQKQDLSFVLSLQKLKLNYYILLHNSLREIDSRIVMLQIVARINSVILIKFEALFKYLSYLFQYASNNSLTEQNICRPCELLLHVKFSYHFIYSKLYVSEIFRSGANSLLWLGPLIYPCLRHDRQPLYMFSLLRSWPLTLYEGHNLKPSIPTTLYWLL